MNNDIDNKYDNELEQPIIAVGDTLYYARIMPPVGTYEVLDLRVITAKDEYFTCIDKRDKRAYIFSYKNINKHVFMQRSKAVKKVKDAEMNKTKINTETHYEEY